MVLADAHDLTYPNKCDTLAINGQDFEGEGSFNLSESMVFVSQWGGSYDPEPLPHL